MKNFYIFALAAILFGACSTDEVQDVAAEMETPETLTVSFEDGDSRIQLQAGKTVWTKGDLLSVFYRSNGNQKWQYQGETGERSGIIKRTATAEATQELSNIVIVYPYNTNYYINPRSFNVQAFLPARQTYLEDSYGLDGNIMISSSEYKQFALKNVCGWLKIQLTGNGEQIKLIKLRGNNGEQVAGEIYINSEDASCELASDGGILGDDTEVGGTIFEDGTVLTEVSLYCPNDVALSSEPTAFYIALPPQTFRDGITIEICDPYDNIETKSTSKEVEITRNSILPMAAFEVEIEQKNPFHNEIYYTNGSTTDATAPVDTGAFGVNIVSNLYNEEKGCWILSFDGDVTSIGAGAFQNCSSLTSIKIPCRVTSIGDNAFYGCSALSSVTMGSGVTSIGKSAFQGCSSLTSVAIPYGVTSIGKSAFQDCSSLTSVAIPYGVTSIGESTFQDCSSLTSVAIPYGVTSIGESAFKNCRILRSVTIPDSVISIGNGAFAYCEGLTSIAIPYGVTSIGESTFQGCHILRSVTIPYGVTSIGESAFWGCYILRNVTIPDSVISIGNSAFAYCRGLTSIAIPNGITSIEDSTFYECSSLTSITIPDSVISIEDQAFSNCRSLTSITIPNSVSSIGNYVFWNCVSLTSITIPDSVTSIGYYAFAHCEGLTSITIPNSVSSIGYYAFWNCKSLTSITIPDSVISIGNRAFSHCKSLVSVYCKPIVPPTGDSNMFEENAPGRKIYVPSTSLSAYQNKEYWQDYYSDIVGFY